MATAPVWSSYWPKGVTASSFDFFGKKAADASSYPNIAVDTPSNYQAFVNNAKISGTASAQLADLFGGPEKYKAAADAYRLAYFNWQNETRPDVLGNQIALEREKANQKASAVYSEEQGLPVAKPLAQIEREDRYNTIRSELENQYNNLVQLDPNAAYRGRTSDLPAVFNQQAAQLADAGVTSITNLRIQDGRLIDNATGNVVTNSNLRGQVAVDRDTGVQKWGDIFSGVEGGANYGIQALEDGSVVLFPAWEKSKSLTSQVLGSDLFKVASLALAAYGIYNLGTTLAGAGGAEAVTAAASGGGSAISGAGLTSAEMAALKGAAAYGEGATAAQIAAGAAGAGVPAAVGALDLPSYGLLDTTTFPTADGISATASTTGGASAPFATTPAYTELTTVVPAGGGAAIVPGVSAPGLSSMGGGTGLLVPVDGGTISQVGLVPPNATPSLGDPGSFINNPDYLGSPVISEDYLGLTTSDMPSGISIEDALNYASKAGNLLGGPQQQGLLGGGQQAGGRQAGGVDYSGLLALLQGRAGVPGVASLIGPVAQPQTSLLDMQPQPVRYQPLTGMINPSLLG